MSASQAVSLVVTASRLLVVSTLLFNVASCFSLTSMGETSGTGSAGILLPPVTGVEEGRPSGPTRSDVVRAWLRALMTSQASSAESGRPAVQRRTVSDDSDVDVEGGEYELNVGDRPQPIASDWRSLTNGWPSSRRRQNTEVCMFSFLTRVCITLRRIFRPDRDRRTYIHASQKRTLEFHDLILLLSYPIGRTMLY